MKEKIIVAMSDVFEMNMSDFPPDVKQESIENWDSLRHLNLIVELEDLFDVSYEPEEIAEMITLDKIVEITQKKQSV